MKLPPRQQAFVREYLLDLNATQAAIRAGYSAKTAEQQGPRLLGIVGVREAIAAAQQKRSARTEITQDRVLQEIARLAFLDPKLFYNEDGSMRTVPEMADDAAAAVTSVEVEEQYAIVDGERQVVGRTKKLKVADKVAALTLAARHLGMLTDKLQHSGEIGLRQLATQMRERATKRKAKA